jgi:hypothetical protein
MKAERRSAQRCAASRPFAGQTRYTRWPFDDPGESNIALVLSAGCSRAQGRKTKGRGRPPGCFRVSFPASFGRSSEMSFRLSFQRSFDASFRRGFAASDVRSDALDFEMSHAQNDEASSEMSYGRSDEVSSQVSVLRCFPANSERSFLARS